MVNESLKAIYIPETSDDWIVVETENAAYELRLGGYKRCHRFERKKFDLFDAVQKGLTILGVYTDGESLYFRLSNSEYLIHGFTVIDSDAEISAQMEYLSDKQFNERYGAGFFDEGEVAPLKTDENGNSF